MKSYKIALSILATATMFASCQKDDVNGGDKSNVIGIGNLSISSPAYSRADIIEINELPSIQTKDADINITEVVTPMEEASSRAGEVTTENIVNETLDLYGYVKNAVDVPNAFHTTFEYNLATEKWDVAPKDKETGETYNWVDEQQHHFWAHFGTPNHLVFSDNESTYSKANFDYENDGREDLMFARTTQLYSTSASQTTSDIQNLTFYHALAGVVINFANEESKKFEVVDADGHDLIANKRVEVTNVSIESYTSGSGSVENNQYSWTVDKTKKWEPTSVYAPDCKMGFLIPQSKSEDRILSIGILDHWGMKTYRVNLPLKFNKDKESAAWQEGLKYTYTVSGKVKLPNAEQTVVTEVNFEQKGWNAVKVMTDIRYVKRLLVEWWGTPHGVEGSFGGLCIEKAGVDLDKKTTSPTEFFDESTGEWKYQNSKFGISLKTMKNGSKWYCERMWDKDCNKGTYIEGDDKTIGTRTYLGHCTATVDTDVLTLKNPNDPVDLYFVAYTDNKGNAKWYIGNIIITVLEYR